MIQEASKSMEEKGDLMKRQVKLQLDRVRESFGDVDERVRTVVRDYPVASFLGAIAVGFLVGRVITRR